MRVHVALLCAGSLIFGAASNARAQDAENCDEATKTCRESRDHICSATAAFVTELTRGQSRGAKETGCVTADQQTRLDTAVGSWTNTTAWVNQLAAFQSGELDTFPRPRPGPIDRAAARMAASGRRAYYRRLLIDALKLAAPNAWGRIQAGSGTAIDTWFSAATATLDAEIVAEAQHSSSTTPSPVTSPLTAALHLVRAFQHVADCSNVPAADGGECARARQLLQLLESTGPLVVRRRVQEIWATDCASISAETVATWVEDIPTPHVAGAVSPWAEVAQNAHAKLFACYLDNPGAHHPYGGWLSENLPAASGLTGPKFQRVDAIRKQWSDASQEAVCARAVRAMQNFVVPPTCTVPSRDFRDTIGAWVAANVKLEDANIPLAVCTQFARLLWEGKTASIDGSFARPPSIDDMVKVEADVPPTPMSRLRAHCEERRGSITSFPADVAALASFARGFGEATERTPFRVDPVANKPIELVRYDSLQGGRSWLQHLARSEAACTALGFEDARCKACAADGPASAYDCALAARLDETWSARTRNMLTMSALFLVVAIGATWLRRTRRARRTYRGWAEETSLFFDGLGLRCQPDRWRIVLPARYDTLVISLPSEDPAWERWGATAALVRVPPGRHVLERDVNHAAFVARRLGASVVLLEHDDDATPDLSAVRAMLEWAAKGGARAVQILPIGVSRARWSKSAFDVLDLVEESSLRGNPFELRGRVATSTQFFNRERLVSGLLAAAQAGHWVVVTGLRRFGKSSLALEVARRLPGPSAYVDVAGFAHEFAHRDDPAPTVDAILRFVCMRLVESARARWPSAAMPAPPAEGSSLDAAALTQWSRELSRACRQASGRAPPILVILDELEQVLAVGPEKLARALDVLAIVIGRLKSAVGDSATPDAGSPMGVFLTSALHPLLWAPLQTLAQQSIMGSFQRVCVPCLDTEAATTMMRSLGARHGIRFTDAALARMVEDSQGVPLLLRRLGSSVLELYDAERARQGSLGAVEVGIEGTTEAVAREEREGSPLRVWVESEIAPPVTVTGALLHHLAKEERITASSLSALAKRMVADDFIQTGIDKMLVPQELSRRAEEAAHVIVQLLHESGLVIPHGDLTAPEAYSLPDGAIRRILANVSASPSARRAPLAAPTAKPTAEEPH